MKKNTNLNVDIDFTKTMLDNNSHNNCVNADKASWAIDKIYFYTDVSCTEGKQTLTFLGDITPTASDKEDYAGNPTLEVDPCQMELINAWP